MIKILPCSLATSCSLFKKAVLKSLLGGDKSIRGR